MINIGPDANVSHLTIATSLALTIVDQVVTANGGTTAPVVLESVTRTADFDAFVFQTTLYRRDIDYLDSLRASLGDTFEVLAVSQGRYRLKHRR